MVLNDRKYLVAPVLLGIYLLAPHALWADDSNVTEIKAPQQVTQEMNQVNVVNIADNIDPDAIALDVMKGANGPGQLNMTLTDANSSQFDIARDGVSALKVRDGGVVNVQAPAENFTGTATIKVTNFPQGQGALQVDNGSISLEKIEITVSATKTDETLVDSVLLLQANNVDTTAIKSEIILSNVNINLSVEGEGIYTPDLILAQANDGGFIELGGDLGSTNTSSTLISSKSQEVKTKAIGAQANDVALTDSKIIQSRVFFNGGTIDLSADQNGEAVNNPLFILAQANNGGLVDLGSIDSLSPVKATVTVSKSAEENSIAIGVEANDVYMSDTTNVQSTVNVNRGSITLTVDSSEQGNDMNAPKLILAQANEGGLIQLGQLDEQGEPISNPVEATLNVSRSAQTNAAIFAQANGSVVNQDELINSQVHLNNVTVRFSTNEDGEDLNAPELIIAQANEFGIVTFGSGFNIDGSSENSLQNTVLAQATDHGKIVFSEVKNAINLFQNGDGIELQSGSSAELTNTTINANSQGSHVAVQASFNENSDFAKDVVNFKADESSITGNFAEIIHVGEKSILNVEVRSSQIGDSTTGVLCYVEDEGQVNVLGSEGTQLLGLLQGTGEINLDLQSKAVWKGKTDMSNPAAGQQIPTVNITLNEEGHVILTGDTSLAKVEMNDSYLEIAKPTDGVVTHVKVNEYIGSGGTLIFNTDLNTVEPLTGLMTIDYHAAEPTKVIIQNDLDPIARILDDSIPLIKATGPLYRPSHLFTSDQVIEGEGQRYVFGYMGRSQDDYVWGLAVPGSEIDSRSLYAAIPYTVLNYGQSIVDSFHERMGDHLINSQGTSSAPTRVWTRFIYEQGKQKEGSLDIVKLRPKMRYHNEAIQVGVTLYQSINDSASQNQLGIYGALGETVAKIGNANEIISGKDKVAAGSMGLYWTYLASLGGYVDTVLQGSYYEAKVINSKDSIKAKGLGILGSIEGGVPFTIAEELVVEPQVQVASQLIHFNAFDQEDKQVKLNHVRSVVGRAGIRAAKQWQVEGNTVSTWIRASGYHEFLGNPRVDFESTQDSFGFKSHSVGSWAEFNLGIDLPVTSTCELYGSSGYSTNFSSNHAYDVKVGLKWAW